MIEKLFSNDNYAMSKTMLDVSAARHEALAANIGNLETPGYHRVDVSKTFLQELQQQFKSGDMTGPIHKAVIEPDATARTTRGDGNNVDLDTELLQLGSNEMQYEVLTDFVSGSLARLKTAITGRLS
ncbi:MAG: flagellar basal-body rod protein FlgB [Chthoniobacter sp.]|jgi:flagellar basal-body rod protein FlgB|nr:flagellar basal-body rod protein FlgB [Chthoniobacter sp.]